MKEHRKETIKVVLMCAFGTLMFAATGIILNTDLCADTVLIERVIYTTLAILLSLFCAVVGFFSYYGYYKKYIKPVKNPESRPSESEIKRKQDVHKRLPGKDIYDALSGYRRNFIITRIVGLSFCMVLTMLVILMKLGDSGVDLRIAFLVGIAVILLACVIAGKKDISFVTEEELRKVIEKSGVDPLRLNTDFLMATNHKLFDGIAVLGMDYLIIYAKQYADVLNIHDIKTVLSFVEKTKINGVTSTKHRMRIDFNSGKYVIFTMKDETESKLFADELEIRGYQVENREDSLR